MESADVIIMGAGLAGLVAACELTRAGRRVILLEQEGENSIGGQAFWSLGGLLMVDTPEQRRLGIRDSVELARQDWFGARRSSTALKMPGPNVGPRRIWNLPVAKCVRGCTVWGCVGWRW